MRLKRKARPASAFRGLTSFLNNWPASYIKTWDTNNRLKQVQYTNPIYNYVPKNGG